jgi:hypothetical protein
LWQHALSENTRKQIAHNRTIIKKAEEKNMKKIAVAVAVLTVVLVGLKKRHAQADRA